MPLLRMRSVSGLNRIPAKRRRGKRGGQMSRLVRSGALLLLWVCLSVLVGTLVYLADPLGQPEPAARVASTAS
jgi:hypothetical protein